MNSKTQESTSAADTSIGFDYQFYYFFFLILGLRHGEKIGLEVKDDVHLVLPDGQTILIQTKHSVQTTAKGAVINLTELDKDLWKTISNWVKIINEQFDPIAYLAKTTFQLVTNKNNNKNNFFKKIKSFSNSEISIVEFKNYLNALRKSTTDISIKEYISCLFKMKNNILSQFLNKMTFALNEDNLIDKIKERILEKIYTNERVNDVYTSLHSSLRDNNYLTVKRGDKIEISFLNFMKNYGHCFKIALSTKLPIRDIPILLPANPENQCFIKQLLDIHALEEFDTEEIIELTTHMLMLYNNLHQWQENGELGPTELKRFDENSILLWKNSFNSKFREIRRRHLNGEPLLAMEDEIQKAALLCLDEIRKEVLSIEETVLDMRLSNGHFYLLADGKNIGWHFDWENKYK